MKRKGASKAGKPKLGRHRGAAGQQQEEWQKFETAVQEMLALAGWTVERDVLIEGGQTDLLALSPGGFARTRMIVECKYSKEGKAISVDAVENFCARVLVLRSKDIADKGLLVTNAAISRFARTVGKNGFVELCTLEQLKRQLFDFVPYVKALIAGAENTPLNELFIRGQMRRIGPGSGLLDQIPIASEVAEDEPVDTVSYVDSWLAEPGGARLSILGDYGTGKTSFCRWYAAYLGRRYLADPDRCRVPLLLRLHRFTTGLLEWEGVVTDFLANECGISGMPVGAFRELLARGDFVLLLDGFDEMARQVDREIRYSTIAALSGLAYGKSRVILTGRPSYFPTQEELEEVLAANSGDDAYSSARLALKELVEYELFQLLPFTPTMVAEYVGKACRDEAQAKQINDVLRDTYNLLDLASRPVLLDMIVRSVPMLIRQKIKVVNAAKLYEVYTASWLDREETKGEFRKLLRKPQKLLFMQELATQMFLQDREDLTSRELGEPIRAFFGITKEDQLEWFSHDVRTCTFLIRADRAAYRFVHQSFQEFFVASALISDARAGKTERWAAQTLSIEIARFTSELLVDDESGARDRIGSWMDSDNKTLARNAAWIIALGKGDLSASAQRLYGLPPRVMQGYAQFSVGNTRSAEDFLQHLYKESVNLGGKYGGQEGREVGHELFYRMMTRLARRAPMTKTERERTALRLVERVAEEFDTHIPAEGFVSSVMQEIDTVEAIYDLPWIDLDYDEAELSESEDENSTTSEQEADLEGLETEALKLERLQQVKSLLEQQRNRDPRGVQVMEMSLQGKNIEDIAKVLGMTVASAIKRRTQMVRRLSRIVAQQKW
jgi:Restriction endonuclease/NACHT domain